ncbi:MAG: phosphoglycerate kinase, partial [Methanobrevibacter sp.]
IIYPEDVAIEEDEERVDVSVDNIPNYSIFDIGKKTSARYSKIILNAKTIFANGPAGVFEDPRFSIGTEDIINSIASSKGYSIIGGGHIGAATVSMGYENKVDHVSSGGGACINLLAGKKLDAVEALIDNKSRHVYH